MSLVDLRSDTVTLPSPQMRAAMAAASVGDDVFGEDPTVNRLEEVAAERLGKQAAIFVPSGTMGNLLGMMLNASPGQEVIADSLSHVIMSEAAGAARLAGVQIRMVETESGVMSAEGVARLVRPSDDPHQPRTAAVWIENTHNRHGGTAWSRSELAAIQAVATRHHLAVHMDGARIFNAAIASDMRADEIAAVSTTVTFCLSKGLGCPVGTLFCGSTSAIDEARRLRKLLGGAMRQVGIIAAAGLYALDHMVDRLHDDHANARLLAEKLSQIPGISCEPARVRTNIVFIDLTTISAKDFARQCWESGVRLGVTGPRRVRLVTHFGIETSDIEIAVDVVSGVMREASRSAPSMPRALSRTMHPN